jgi:hypothetical protein
VPNQLNRASPASSASSAGPRKPIGIAGAHKTSSSFSMSRALFGGQSHLALEVSMLECGGGL